ncbi:MAG TPA: 2-oxoglutarate dehydrogenase E1 component, partial [Chitinophagaceae bacterium]|nr:2-oxoglutarate dehydrogenase E1 component [Chitinophagaceae bacterium]
MKDFSYITNSHPAYIESLYRAFEADPNSVDADLKKFFEGFDFAVNIGAVSDVKTSANGTAVSAGNLSKEFAVYQLIQAYRKKGHLIAKTNPIRPRKDRKANLDLSYFGLSDADLATKFDAGKFIGLEQATLKDILAKLTKCYASSVG